MFFVISLRVPMSFKKSDDHTSCNSLPILSYFLSVRHYLFSTDQLIATHYKKETQRHFMTQRLSSSLPSNYPGYDRNINRTCLQENVHFKQFGLNLSDRCLNKRKIVMTGS